MKAGDSVKISVTVANTGSRTGDEVVQLYLTDCLASIQVPIRKLVGLRRVTLKAKEA